MANTQFIQTTDAAAAATLHIYFAAILKTRQDYPQRQNTHICAII